MCKVMSEESSNKWKRNALPIENKVSMLYSYIIVGVGYLCYHTSPWGKAKDKCNIKDILWLLWYMSLAYFPQ